MQLPNPSPISLVFGSGLAALYGLLGAVAFRGVFVWVLFINMAAFAALLGYFWNSLNSAPVVAPRVKKSHFVKPIDLTGKPTSPDVDVEPIFSLTVEDDEFISGAAARFSKSSGQQRRRRPGLNVIPNRQKLIYKNSASQRKSQRPSDSES